MGYFNLAEWYAKLRGSPIFVLVLIAWVGTWVTLHSIFGFDPEFGMLNLMLSTEASVSLAFFTMMGERDAKNTQAAMVEHAKDMDQLQSMSKLLITMAEVTRDEIAQKIPAKSQEPSKSDINSDRP